MASPKRPGALLAIAIIGLVLGLLGGCVGVFGIVTPIFQERLQAAQHEQLTLQGAPEGLGEAQRNAEERMNAVTRKWTPFTVTHQAFNLLLSLALVGASLLLLMVKPAGPLLFSVAAVGNVVIDIAGTALGIFVQRESMDAMKEMMRDPAMTGSAGSAEAAHLMDGILGASVWVGVCFGGLWVALKLGYYIAGVVYLRKPATKQLFAPPVGPSATPPASLRGDLL